MHQNGHKKKAKESIPKTNMPDLLKTYGNCKNGFRQQVQHQEN